MTRPVYGRSIRVDSSSWFLLRRVTWQKMAAKAIAFTSRARQFMGFPNLLI